jgi:predicted permease
MSVWVTALIGTVGALFLISTLLAAFQGNWEATKGGLFCFGFVAFIGFMGWVDTRYPQPPRPAGEKYSLWSDLKRFEERYPGWPGKLATYGVPTILLLAAISQFVGALRSLGVRW